MNMPPTHPVSPTTDDPVSPEAYEPPALAQECSRQLDARPHGSNRLRISPFALRFLSRTLLVACMTAAVAGCDFPNSVQGTTKSPAPSLGSAPRAGIPSSMVGRWSGTLIMRDYGSVQTNQLNLTVSGRPQPGLIDPVYGTMTLTDPNPKSIDGLPVGDCKYELITPGTSSGATYVDGYPTTECWDANIKLTLVGPNTLSYSADNGSLGSATLIRQAPAGSSQAGGNGSTAGQTPTTAPPANANPTKHPSAVAVLAILALLGALLALVLCLFTPLGWVLVGSLALWGFFLIVAGLGFAGWLYNW